MPASMKAPRAALSGGVLRPDKRRVRRRHQAQEDALLAQDEALALREFVILTADRVAGQPRLVRLVRGQAFNVVDAVPGVLGARVGREKADEIRAEPRDGLTPYAAVLLECGCLERVDLIAARAPARARVL